jgi:hypothetical protein
MSDCIDRDPAHAVRALAEELTQTVALARALVASGRRIDLTGLDSQIGLLCAKWLDLPLEEGRRLRPWLVTLSAAVDALSRVMSWRPAPSG